MGRDRGRAMVVSPLLKLLPVLLCILSLSGAENPLERLDAGEVAEVDDGDFADVFDDADGASPVAIGDDTRHMSKDDVDAALSTWEVLYGHGHTENLGEMQESAGGGKKKKLAKLQAKKTELREKIMKTKSTAK